MEAYSTLVDKAIGQLDEAGTGQLNPDQRKFSQLLIDDCNQGLKSQSLEVLNLENLLRTNPGEPFAGMKQFCENLLHGRIDTSDQKRLETID